MIRSPNHELDKIRDDSRADAGSGKTVIKSIERCVQAHELMNRAFPPFLNLTRSRLHMSAGRCGNEAVCRSAGYECRGESGEMRNGGKPQLLADGGGGMTALVGDPLETLRANAEPM